MRQNITHKLIFMRCMLFILAFSVICGIASAKTPNKLKWKVGNKPTYRLQCMTGDLFTPEIMRGKYVVMHFWASWNRGSTESIRYLKTVWPDFKENNIKLISISLDQSLYKVRNVIAKEKVDWPVYFSRKKSARVLADRMNIIDFPRICIISKSGVLLWVGHPINIDHVLENLLQDDPSINEKLTSGELDLVGEMAMKRQIKDYRLNPDELREVQRNIVIAKRAAQMHDLELLEKTIKKIPLQAIYDKDLSDRMLDLGEKVHRYILSQPDVAKHFLEDHIFMQRLSNIGKLVGREEPNKASMRDLKNIRVRSNRNTNHRLLEKKLAEAKEYEKSDVIKAYNIYSWIVEYARLQPEGQTALKRIEAIRKSKSYGPIVGKLLSDEDKQRLYKNAKRYLAKGNRNAAIVELKSLIKYYGSSMQARDARSLLTQLENEQREIDESNRISESAHDNRQVIKRND
ncbi:redoxin domain-containing protein [Planctomycetota bacterium]|nr:redoxin domain-containing protein [Planctomycetota bacterium]